MPNVFSKKNILLTIIIVFSILILAGGIFTVSVYIEFLSNRNFIFDKLDAFSQALKYGSETEEMLGVDGKRDRADDFTIVYDRNKKIITKYSPEKYRLVPIKQLPYYLTNGFMLSEDRKFFEHNGFNYQRIILAVFRNIITLGKSPGGSTISQQLAKILFTKHERNIRRKGFEFFCTLELEKRFSKEEILQIYLNSIYMGHGVYGMADAARFYFGKDASDLTLAESALLIGMNRSPERYSPIRDRKRAIYIQKVITSLFVREKYIDSKEALYDIERMWQKVDEAGTKGVQSLWRAETNNSGYLTEIVRQILSKEFEFDDVLSRGLIVETTFDLDRQRLAEKVIAERMAQIKEYIRKTVKDRNPPVLTDVEIEQLETSFSSLDFRTGEVLAVVGGTGFNFSNQFNRALYSYRPIGSTVKSFVYGMALSDRVLNGLSINPFTKFKDEIKTYKIYGKDYRPLNYYANHKYGEMVTLYDALKRSLNTISVEVMNQMDDYQSVADIIVAAGMIKDPKRVPAVLSLALGTCEMSAYEVATAYSIFPRGGSSVTPYMIRKISDSKGFVYYDVDRENNPYFGGVLPVRNTEQKHLVTPAAAYEVMQMMRAVFDNGGTGYWARNSIGLSVPAYAKSGTSQDFRDNWFVGFTDKETSAVWVGFDDNKSLAVPGSMTASYIWCAYNQAVSDFRAVTIDRPKNMRLVKICLDSGLLAATECSNTTDFFFDNDGTLPERCYIHSGFETEFNR